MRRVSAAALNGFTLLEVTMAMILTTVMALAVQTMVHTGQENSRFVHTESGVIKGLRESGNLLALDLRRASPSKLTITRLRDGNDRVDLQMPLGVSAGAIQWGVYDLAAGTDNVARSRAGWSIRYEVVAVPTRDGKVDRQLRRRLLDANGKVVRQRSVLDHLLPGLTTTPGFRLAKTGSMYRVTLYAMPDPSKGEKHARNLSFDVAIRNQ